MVSGNIPNSVCPLDFAEPSNETSESNGFAEGVASTSDRVTLPESTNAQIAQKRVFYTVLLHRVQKSLLPLPLDQLVQEITGIALLLHPMRVMTFLHYMPHVLMVIWILFKNSSTVAQILT